MVCEKAEDGVSGGRRKQGDGEVGGGREGWKEGGIEEGVRARPAACM